MKLMITLPMNITENQIDNYMKEGVDIIRFNFSHIDYERFIYLYKYIREKYPQVKILQDLQGQKIRVLSNYKYSTKIESGKKVCFCSEKFYLQNLFKVSYILIPVTWNCDFHLLYEQSKKILIGSTEFKKEKVEQECIYCIALSDCIIRADKGINFVGIDRTKLLLTEKDRYDLDFIKKYPVDYICMSFVESVNLLKELKTIINEFSYNAKLIAKIETMNGVNNLKEILVECNGIMIGRGDLSKEVDNFVFGEIQSNIVNIMNCWHNKEFIIGTYILQNMIYNKQPTVSELTAIQYFKENKIDTLMLSDEILIGKYPYECIKFLKALI